jgi:nuclease S1
MRAIKARVGTEKGSKTICKEQASLMLAPSAPGRFAWRLACEARKTITAVADTRLKERTPLQHFSPSIARGSRASSRRHNWRERRRGVRLLVTRSIVLALLACVSPQPAFAWGREGHQVVANIAQARLSPAARQAVDRLLHGATLASVAVWADVYGTTHPETTRWHYVDIPLNGGHYDTERDCVPTLHGDCIIAALDRSVSILRDATRSETERTDALKFAIHLVGDLHQPLHSSNNNDQGGVDTWVTFFGVGTSLHSLWNGGMIEAADETTASLTDECERLTTVVQPGGSPIAWAEEARDVAARSAYAIPPDRVLNRDYLEASLQVLRLQLLRGGVRLAALLNDIFEGTGR